MSDKGEEAINRAVSKWQERRAEMTLEQFKDLLYSRNKWHMLCEHFNYDPRTSSVATISDRLERVESALRGILEIGKRDLTNPKYDSYFEAAHEALKEKQ